MSWKNRVIWSEGLFLRPQHFQQQARYLEGLVEERCAGLRSFAWGFRELKIDSALLAVGKLAVAQASGVFPDGTPFDVPNDDAPPPPLDISGDLRDVVVYLALPVRRPGTVDVQLNGTEEGMARVLPREYDVRDATSRTLTTATLQVGCLRMRLLTQHEERGDYACMGLAHVVEVRTDRQVVLRDDFIAPVLDCQASRVLQGFTTELQGLLHHRGEALAERMSPGKRDVVAEEQDFLTLLAINRYEPLIAHLSTLHGLHPEDLYSALLPIAGELATFHGARRPRAFPAYRHDDLRATFKPLMDTLRESLSMVIEQHAVPIELKERKFGIRVGTVPDRTLLASATFVLAVSADLSPEQIRKHFPAQTKVAPAELITDLVRSQLPGIPLFALPVAPRQLPYRSGYVYFELDRAADYWKKFKDTGGIGIHIGGEYPNLQMQLWAIRAA